MQKVLICEPYGTLYFRKQYFMDVKEAVCLHILIFSYAAIFTSENWKQLDFFFFFF